MNALLLENLSVRLRGACVVDHVSLHVGKGEVVALLGPNGAGKTSLLRAALGLIAHTGVVLLDGVSPLHLNARERALRAAYLPQRPRAAWPISVEALVALGRFAHGAAPDRLGADDRLAVDDAIEACGLVTLRDRRIDVISGGERARAHLARTLAQRAPLILLDEPTASLDPAQALGVMSVLRKHAGAGGAVLFSTHDIALAANAADRVVLLCGGKVLAAGSAEALTPAVLERAYGRKGRLEHLRGGHAALFEA
ncbi:MAG: ABC transporter ATP-binding protein [Hyphomonadaceae bacterium]